MQRTLPHGSVLGLSLCLVRLLSRVKPVSSNTASVSEGQRQMAGVWCFSGNDVPRNPGQRGAIAPYPGK
jgi:hypothetical protein